MRVKPRLSVVGGVRGTESWHGPPLHGRMNFKSKVTLCGLPLDRAVNGNPVVTTYYPQSIGCAACRTRILKEDLLLPGAGW